MHTKSVDEATTTQNHVQIHSWLSKRNVTKTSVQLCCSGNSDSHHQPLTVLAQGSSGCRAAQLTRVFDGDIRNDE